MSQSRPPTVYRLEQLLRLRQYTLSQRRHELAQTWADVQAAAARAEVAQQRVLAQQHRIASLSAQTPSSGRVDERTNYDQYASRLREQLLTFQAEHQRCVETQQHCATELLRQRIAVQTAEAALRAVEEHKARWTRARQRDRAERETEEAMENRATHAHDEPNG